MKEHRPLGWTTIEEAKQLVNAGLDPNTADMRYEENNYELLDEWVAYTFGGDIKNFDVLKKEFPDSEFYPCWSLGSLIDLMPSKLYTEIGYCYLSLYKDPMSFDRLSILFDDNLYRVAYDYEEGENCEHKDYKSTEKDESLMSVIVEMVIWLIHNNHIKKHE